MALILLGTTNSKATLQANPTTHKSPVSKNGATWITEIRQMETANQTMGLNETLNGLNATSASNGIDVHMMLPTEYGAVAILSASGYGNPKKLRDEANAQKRTTTGNATGVYFTGDRWEWIAATGCLTNSKYNNTNYDAIGTILATNGLRLWHDGATGIGVTMTDGKVWKASGENYVMSLRHFLAGGAGIFTYTCLEGVNDNAYNPWSTHQINNNDGYVYASGRGTCINVNEV